MQSRSEVLNACFLDVRCMALEIASALDRLDRAGTETPEAKMKLLKEALNIVASPSAGPDRAKRILMLFSDPVE